MSVPKSPPLQPIVKSSRPRPRSNWSSASNAISESPLASIRPRSINSSTSWSNGRDQPPSHCPYLPGHGPSRHAPGVRWIGLLDHLCHRRESPLRPLFVFRNRRGDRLKILYWDRDGLALWAKRLERGVFRFPTPRGHRLEVTPAELAAILEGIDLKQAQRQRRYVWPAATPS